METRLDNYETKPSGMDNYLQNYGWHFSKKMCEWAVSMMKGREGNSIKMVDKNSLEQQLLQRNLKMEHKGYDIVYVYCMAKSDFFGSSLINDEALYKYVYDYIGDKDGYESIAFTRFYADTIAKGIPVIWEDMM